MLATAVRDSAVESAVAAAVVDMTIAELPAAGVHTAAGVGLVTAVGWLEFVAVRDEGVGSVAVVGCKMMTAGAV